MVQGALPRVSNKAGILILILLFKKKDTLSHCFSGLA